MKSRIIAITGVTSIGKTEVAFEIAKRLGANVICGDKVQIIAGYPRITGAVDHEQFAIGSFLYGSSKLRMDRATWRNLVKGITSAVGGEFVIDGLAWLYMRQALDVGAIIFRLNPDMSKLRKYIEMRLDREIQNGLLDEVRRGERDLNLIKESCTAEFLSKHTRGEQSLEDAKNLLIEYSMKRADIKVNDSNTFSQNFIEVDHDVFNKEKTVEYIMRRLHDSVIFTPSREG